jgi:hypothetical protein
VFLARAHGSTHTNRVLCLLCCNAVVRFQNSSAPYPKNPLLREGDDALIDVISFILFFKSEFSSFTVCISSSISISLVLNSSTNFCKCCNISNVVLLILIAAAAASVDAVGTPMVRDIMEWNGIMEV